MYKRLLALVLGLLGVLISQPAECAKFYAAGGDITAYYFPRGGAGDGSDFLINGVSAQWDSKITFLGNSKDFGSFAAGSELNIAIHDLVSDVYLSADQNAIASSFAGLKTTLYWQDFIFPAGTMLAFNDRPTNTDFDNLFVVVTNITENPTGSVPETATWLMMTLGLGLIGGYLRKSRGQQPYRRSSALC